MPTPNGFILRYGEIGPTPVPTDQIRCVLRNVGTYNLAPGTRTPTLEARDRMVPDSAQGQVEGYNPPSLLGLAMTAPYFHSGNARTLEEALHDSFELHHRAGFRH